MTMQIPETSKPTEAKKTRVFIADNRQFPDPDPNLPVEAVLQMLTEFMPELHNAKTKTTEKDGKAYIEFIKTCGTKG